MLRYARPQPVAPVPGEQNELRLPPARRRRRDPAVELPARDPGRHDDRRDRHRQHRRAEAVADAASDRAGSSSSCWRRSGLPAGVVNFVTGGGGDGRRRAGRAPARRASSRSPARKEVGLRINEDAPPRSRPGQIWIKRVVAEMGGKDAIVVDETADLDAAAHGVVASAFGFQGQKCSACSRAIVDETVYDALLEKLVDEHEDAERRRPGDPDERRRPGDQRGRRSRSASTSRSASKEGRLVAGGEAGPARRLLRPADDHRRRQPRARHRPGGDLRPGAGGDHGEGLRRRARSRQRHRVRPDRRRLLAGPRAGSSAPSASSSSATSTSTASAPARSSACTPSAASTCPAPTRRPAAATTSASSCRRRRSPRSCEPRPRLDRRLPPRRPSRRHRTGSTASAFRRSSSFATAS